MALDWRREFLQVVQEAFEKEREVLKARLRGSDPGGYSSVLERLERVVQGQVSPASARRPEGPPPPPTGSARAGVPHVRSVAAFHRQWSVAVTEEHVLPQCTDNGAFLRMTPGNREAPRVRLLHSLTLLWQ